MFCKNCGAETDSSKKFCTSCGKSHSESLNSNDSKIHSDLQDNTKLNTFSIMGFVYTILIALLTLPVIKVGSFGLRRYIPTDFIVSISAVMFSIIGLRQLKQYSNKSSAMNVIAWIALVLGILSVLIGGIPGFFRYLIYS